MKTAISIPDPEFEAAEKLAQRLGLSRSELYRTAIADYITRHSDKSVTEKLDEIFGVSQTTGGLDEDLRRLQEQSIPEERW